MVITRTGKSSPEINLLSIRADISCHLDRSPIKSGRLPDFSPTSTSIISTGSKTFGCRTIVSDSGLPCATPSAAAAFALLEGKGVGNPWPGRDPGSTRCERGRLGAEPDLESALRLRATFEG